MLVVKIEIHDAKNHGNVTQVGEMTIINDGTGNKVLGNYQCRIASGIKDAPLSTFIPGHARTNSPWLLVWRALSKLLDGGQGLGG